MCALQIGITLVGTSSLLGGEGSSTHEISPQKMLLGMGLIVASQVGTLLCTVIHSYIRHLQQCCMTQSALALFACVPCLRPAIWFALL